jgi:hypothetical protein
MSVMTSCEVRRGALLAGLTEGNEARTEDDSRTGVLPYSSHSSSMSLRWRIPSTSGVGSYDPIGRMALEL